MTKLAVSKMNFEDGTSLNYSHLSFDHSVYSERELGVVRFEPKVISSPQGSGKSTMVQFIQELHQSSYQSKLNWLTIDLSLFRDLSTNGFKELLVDKLASTKIDNFEEILTSSSWRDHNARNVIHLFNIQDIDANPLRWLLGVIRSLVEAGDTIFFENRVQVILEGGFILHKLTAGLTSLFPLDQIFPKEFSQVQLKEFMEDRGVILSDQLFELFWYKTEGDKQISQSILKLIEKTIKHRGIDTTIDNQVSNILTNNQIGLELKDRFLQGLNNLILKLGWLDKPSRILSFLNELKDGDKWFNQPLEIQKILFDSGLVKKLDVSTFVLRAQVVVDIAALAIRRLNEVRDLLDMKIVETAMLVQASEDFSKRKISICQSAFMGTLSDLHVGNGGYSDGQLSFTGKAWRRGSYTGIWQDIHPKQPIDGMHYWCIAYNEVDNKEEFTYTMKLYEIHQENN